MKKSPSISTSVGILLTVLIFNTANAQGPPILDEESLLRETIYTSLKEALTMPDSVRVLDLSDQALTEWPPEIFNFKYLQKLSLYSNTIQEVPPQIKELERLEWLDLYNNNLSSLPTEFSELERLRYLDLGGNNLKTFPPVLLALDSLRQLHLYGNHLRSLPEEIEQLRQLNVLRLGRGLVVFFGGNRIRKLPSSFGKLENLEELYLPDNRLRQLPDSFENLKKLRWLDAGYNRFSDIPPSVYELDSLQYLRLWDRGFPRKNIEKLESQKPEAKLSLYRDYEGPFWGGSLAFQQGKYSVVEVGIVRAFKKDLLVIASGVSAELNLNGEMHGGKFSVWANGLSLLSLGLHAGYYRDKSYVGMLRPEIGLGWKALSLTYGYNILFNNPLERGNAINKHLFSLRAIIPIAPYFSIFR